MSYPTHLDPIEAQIIAKIIDSALERGYLISVFDGEDDTLATSLRELIEPEIAATDETTLAFYLPRGTARPLDFIGAVLLIHGNGADVISDYHDTEELRAILADAEGLAVELAQ